MIIHHGRELLRELHGKKAADNVDKFLDDWGMRVLVVVLLGALVYSNWCTLTALVAAKHFGEYCAVYADNY